MLNDGLSDAAACVLTSLCDIIPASTISML